MAGFYRINAIGFAQFAKTVTAASPRNTRIAAKSSKFDGELMRSFHARTARICLRSTCMQSPLSSQAFMLRGICSMPSFQLDLPSPYPSTPKCKTALSEQPCRQYSTKKLKSNSKKKAVQKKEETLTDDEDDDDDTDLEERDEVEDEDEDVEGETDEKKDWKDMKMSVPSTRVDAVLSAGLGISRKKIEDAFLDAKLRLNGKKVMKKSKHVLEGDTLDLIKDAKGVSKKDGAEVTFVMRVEVRQIGEEKTKTEKTPVILRRWKHLELPRNK